MFVPPRNAETALIEAIDAEMPLVVCVTERVPVLDMVRVKRALEGSNTRLIGPNSPGIIAPGAAKIGVMPAHLHTPGKVGIVSRSATLTYEAVDQTTAYRLGQSTSVGIGGDPVYGLGFIDCVKLFREDPQTRAILLIGEIGGTAEEKVADFLKAEAPGKPVVGFVAGLEAPLQRRLGHAGTLDVYGERSGRAKVEALREAGVQIAPSVADIGATLHRALAA